MPYNTLSFEQLNILRNKLYLLLQYDRDEFTDGLVILWTYELLTGEISAVNNLSQNQFKLVKGNLGILNSFGNILKLLRDGFVHEGILKGNLIVHLRNSIDDTVLSELFTCCKIDVEFKKLFFNRLKSL